VESPEKDRTVRRISVSDGEINWGQADEMRVRRFNLQVVLFAVAALVLLIGYLVIGWLAFS
jgi:hypothetical protein